MTWIKRQVVMLPTNEKAPLILHENGLLYSFRENKIHLYDEKCKYQHLYFLSDEEIKGGDWVYSKITNSIFQVKATYNEHCKKIIATTDQSLLLDFNKEGDGGCDYLPQPSDSFIQKYVETYNEGKPITEVMVEYEIDQKEGEYFFIGGKIREVEKIFKSEANNQWYFVTNSGSHAWNCTYNELKVNPKNNNITIHKIKDSWTREEVIAFAKKYAERCQAPIKAGDRWIEENL